MLDKPSKKQSEWLINTELHSEEFLSASFRVVLSHYTPFITYIEKKKGNELEF